MGEQIDADEDEVMMDKMIEAISLWVIVAAASGSSMAELERLVSGEQLAGEKDFVDMPQAYRQNNSTQRFLKQQ